jgi:hypothetical protein
MFKRDFQKRDDGRYHTTGGFMPACFIAYYAAGENKQV